MATTDPTPGDDRKPAAPPAREQSTAVSAAVSLDGATLPSSRRKFFRSLAFDGVTAVSTAYLARVAAAAASSPGAKFDTHPNCDLSVYSNTNAHVTLPSGASFHNLGVRHTSRRFMVVRETILQAIQSNDVVLIEGHAGQSYFDFVAALAHHHGKVVVRLESGKSWLHDVGASLSSPFGFLVVLRNGCHFLSRGVWALLGAAAAVFGRGMRGRGDSPKIPSEDSEETRKGPAHPSAVRAAISAGAALNYYAFGVSDHVMCHDSNKGEYPIRDHSYTADGRTVLMLKDIERYALEHLDQRVLAITGDLHARGFTYYASSPERYEAYQHRAQWYEQLYRSWLNGRPRVEVDPALTGREPPLGS